MTSSRIRVVLVVARGGRGAGVDAKGGVCSFKIRAKLKSCKYHVFQLPFIAPLVKGGFWIATTCIVGTKLSDFPKVDVMMGGEGG